MTTLQPRPPRLPWQAKFAALSLIWGSSFLLIRLGLDAFHPVQIAWLRVLTGLTVLLVLLRVAGGQLPRAPRLWGHLFVTGFFVAALPFTLFAFAEQRIPSALAGIANSTSPLVAVLLGFAVLRQDRLTPRQLGCVAAGFIGVGLLLQPWELTAAPDPAGLTMALIASASYAVGWTWVKRFLAADDPGGLGRPTAQLLCAAAQLSVITVAWWVTSGRTAPWSAVALPGRPVWVAVAAVLTLGAVGTGLAQGMQYDVVRATSPTVAIMVTYVIPVLSLIHI